MSQSKRDDVSEAEIAVHWQEEAYVHPPEKFVAQANLTDPKVFDRFSLKNFPDCFKEYADLLDWYKPWDVMLDTSKPPFWKWFVGGRINVSYDFVIVISPGTRTKRRSTSCPSRSTKPFSTSPTRNATCG